MFAVEYCCELQGNGSKIVRRVDGKESKCNLGCCELKERNDFCQQALSFSAFAKPTSA